MAGPYTGTWLASAVSQAEYTGAAKWGTGINPIHSIEGAGFPLRGSRIKVGIYPEAPPGGQETDVIAEDYSWDNTLNPDPELPYYNVTDSELWGDNSETGIADRPQWGSELGDRDSSEDGWALPNPPTDNTVLPDTRGKTQNDTSSDFPSWGGTRKTKPAGTLIRSLRRGAQMISSARVLPNEDVAQGWLNKDHGISPDSRPSDDSQIFIQTSAVQRRQVRAGSQRSGSQSTFTAPIASRETGQKVKVYAASDSARHWDMLPYEQEDYMRPFLSRTAGTGYREWMYENEMYVSPSIQREPAADPQLGPIAGSGGDTGVFSYEDAYYG